MQISEAPSIIMGGACSLEISMPFGRGGYRGSGGNGGNGNDSDPFAGMM